MSWKFWILFVIFVIFFSLQVVNGIDNSGNGSAEAAHEGAHEDEHKKDKAEERWWLVGRALLFGSAAIVVIGVGGLLAVLSIKWLTRMRFYDYLQQALIALAVGALIGDAFMHLIPHALLVAKGDGAHAHEHEGGGEEEEGPGHLGAILLGLVGALGIYAFLLLNRLSEFFHIFKHAGDSSVSAPNMELECADQQHRHSHHHPSDEPATATSAPNGFTNPILQQAERHVPKLPTIPSERVIAEQSAKVNANAKFTADKCEQQQQAAARNGSLVPVEGEALASLAPPSAGFDADSKQLISEAGGTSASESPTRRGCGVSLPAGVALQSSTHLHAPHHPEHHTAAAFQGIRPDGNPSVLKVRRTLTCSGLNDEDHCEAEQQRHASFCSHDALNQLPKSQSSAEKPLALEVEQQLRVRGFSASQPAIAPPDGAANPKLKLKPASADVRERAHSALGAGADARRVDGYEAVSVSSAAPAEGVGGVVGVGGSEGEEQQQHYVDMVGTGHGQALRQSHHVHHHHTHEAAAHGHSHGGALRDPSAATWSSLVWTVLVGDGMHNLCDGLAIGSQFMINPWGGLSTSVAIFFHEIPHEIGDFALLIHCGVSVRVALVSNLISTLISAVGMCLGVALASIVSITPYIFMITAGMFFYIALAAMMPELITVLPNRKSRSSMLLLFACQNLGVLLGYALLLGIAVFEELTAAHSSSHGGAATNATLSMLSPATATTLHH